MMDDRADAGSDENDRFGVPDSSIRAEVERHRGILRSGMYIPTRGEVRGAPFEWLAPILLDWVFESPSLLIPSNDQVENVIAELETRSDADTDEVRRLIAELRAS